MARCVSRLHNASYRRHWSEYQRADTHSSLPLEIQWQPITDLYRFKP
jgi:hypothetical protein